MSMQTYAKEGKMEPIQALLSQGVSVNSQDSFGETALHETARYGHVEICKLLLDKRADVHINAPGNNGWQPLHIAGHYGKVEVARILMEHGASVNNKDARGDIPLTLAVRNKQVEMVRLLVAYGSSPHTLGKDGKSAVQLVKQLDIPALAQALTGDVGPSPMSPVSPAPDVEPAQMSVVSSAVVAGATSSHDFQPSGGLRFGRTSSLPISISVDGLTATQLGDQGGMAFGSMSFTSGKHSWSILIRNCQGNYLDVGITAAPHQYLVPISGLHAHGSAVLVQKNCGVRGMGEYVWQPFKTGMEVTCLLDMDARTLSFNVSGTLIPNIITSIPPEVWPAVHIREKGWSCSIGTASAASNFFTAIPSVVPRPISFSDPASLTGTVAPYVSPPYPSHVPPELPPPGPRNWPGGEEFLEACGSGDLSAVEAYAQRGGNFDSVADSKGDTGLILAARAGTFPVVKFLLERGAAVNRTNDSGSSALLASAMRGHDSVVSALIERKAYVHQRTEKGDSALSLACWKNNTACAMMLLTAGADPLQVDQFGDTMLLDAAKHGNQAIMSLLISKGLPLDHQNKEGKTALIRAAEFGKPEGIQLLLQQGADMELADSQGRTALFHAVIFCEQQHSQTALNVIRMLVEKGASTNARDRAGRTVAESATSAAVLQALGVSGSGALAAASATAVPGAKSIQDLAKAGKTDEVRLRLDTGVDVNTKDSYGETALHETARYGHDNTAALLLQRRADVHIQAERNNGWQPLHIAGHYGKLGVAMQLLQNRAEINFKDSRGDTPLTLATRNKQDMLVRFLVEQGADPTIPGKDGKSAKEIAATGNLTAILEILNTTCYKPMSGSSGMWTCPSCQVVNENTNTCKGCNEKASASVLEDLQRKTDLARAEQQLKRREEELKTKSQQIEQTRQRLLDGVPEEEIPSEFLCPISYSIMMDPVTLMDGHSYERSVITEWFVRGNTTSPLTGAPLSSTVIKPNFALRASIDRFLKEKSKEPLAQKLIRQNSMEREEEEQKRAAEVATAPFSDPSSPSTLLATSPLSLAWEADTSASVSQQTSESASKSRLAEVKGWGTDQVAQWLTSVKISSEYVDKFRQADIDGPTLLELDEQTLEEDIGIDKRLVRKKIIGQIKTLHG
eukprot:gb/GEZN01000717.1/.p1 GENE.gb/GEZN01000717.1/~~gb/GEZN01000717.1/.p1  ORF type:complete len:1135 (+),score=233.59 gb/GEZN01000717.1/:179-3583(+)